jgi:predicted ATP-binding protein involved in virulence
MLNLQNIRDAKNRLENYDPNRFNNIDDSFRYFTQTIEVADFRHINNLTLSFSHPITVITGTNKIGKTSILLLIACSHYDFKRFDSTKPETEFRRHTWRDVLPFTGHENANRDYSYKLWWRVGTAQRNGEAKRLANSQAWTGVGKASSDIQRVNSQIRGREVRLIDLERLVPARNTSNSLLRKINNYPIERLQSEVEQAFGYVFDSPNVQINKIGSHINKTAYLINYQNNPY